jgi:hypothetical protein
MAPHPGHASALRRLQRDPYLLGDGLLGELTALSPPLSLLGSTYNRLQRAQLLRECHRMAPTRSLRRHLSEW